MREVHNIFEPKASRIVRCLLVEYGRPWTLRELASEAHVALGYTHAAVATLLSMGYVARNDLNKLIVVDPARLLRRWAAYHQYDRMNRFIEYYTFEREIERQLKPLAKISKPDYALTSLVAAWLMAPYVRPVDIHLYVRSEAEAKMIGEKLRLSPIPSGGNVKMVIPYDEGVFYGIRQIGGVKVASPVQLYVDLYNFAGRGEEASSKILQLLAREWAKKEGTEIVR